MADGRSLRVNDQLSIPLSEIELRASRSSGPGGQHANVTASRIEAVFDVRASPTLTRPAARPASPAAGERVTAVAQDARSQARNRELALERLAEKLAAALHRPKRRRPTRPGRAAKERRLEQKRRARSARQQRRRPAGRLVGPFPRRAEAFALSASIASIGVGSTPWRAARWSETQVAEHHELEDPRGPGLALGLDADHRGGVGLDQLAGDLEAAALARVLVDVARAHAGEAPLRALPSGDLVVARLGERRRRRPAACRSRSPGSSSGRRLGLVSPAP